MADRPVYEWSDESAAKVSRLFELAVSGVEEAMGEFSYMYDAGGDDPQSADSLWTVEVYETFMELVEPGEDDGAQIFHGYGLDLSAVLAAIVPDAEVGPRLLFDTSVAPAGGGLPKVTLCGRFEGQAVNLEICGRPPDDAEVTGRRHHTSRGVEFEDIDDDGDEEDEDEED